MRTSPWGEHEIDYVLFFCVKNKSLLTIQPHPDEVDAVKWVTRESLMSMMADTTLLFSPWFRIICKKWLLDSWWKDLTVTMTTDQYCDYVTIHRFDPPKEVRGVKFVGCGGNPWMFEQSTDTCQLQHVFTSVFCSNHSFACYSSSLEPFFLCSIWVV
jgi:hypothetical protein